MVQGFEQTDSLYFVHVICRASGSSAFTFFYWRMYAGASHFEVDVFS